MCTCRFKKVSLHIHTLVLMNDAPGFNHPTGPLESDNHYVAEYLVRQAGEQLPSVFFRRVQAGFVFGYNEHVDRDLDCLTDTPSRTFSPSTNNLTATIWYNNQVSHIHVHTQCFVSS